MAQLLPLFEQFKVAVSKNAYGEATAHLAQLKVKFASLKSFLPQAQTTAVSQETKQEILLVRETLEQAVLLSAKMKDLQAFERNINQVKTYYNFSAPNVEASPREPVILGLNLMRLLAQNRIADFHTELELIPVDSHSNMYIKHPIDLELYLMEGSYNKLRNARTQVPASEYLVFMDILTETVRKEFAACAERAYTSLKVADATKLLLFQNDGETLQFCQARNWNVQNSVISFDKSNAQDKTFQRTAKEVIGKTLSYAHEVSQIL